jgi:hypothetical protein
MDGADPKPPRLSYIRLGDGSDQRLELLDLFVGGESPRAGNRIAAVAAGLARTAISATRSTKMHSAVT